MVLHRVLVGELLNCHLFSQHFYERKSGTKSQRVLLVRLHLSPTFCICTDDILANLMPTLFAVCVALHMLNIMHRLTYCGTFRFLSIGRGGSDI